MNILITVIAGGLLAAMLYLNGSLGIYTDPIWSSFVAHLVGTLGAFFLLLFVKKESIEVPAKPAKWLYTGGIIGAVIVIISNITFNSKLGISGTFVLMLLGQTVLSAVIDHFGLLGMQKRKITRVDLVQMGFVCLGSFILVAYAK